MNAEGQTVRIGRGQGCDLVLTHASVSRRHAELTIEPDGSVEIRDLSSTGGTFVLRGGKELPVTHLVRLQPSDGLRLGEYEISLADLLGLIDDTRAPAVQPESPPRPLNILPIQTGETPKTRRVRCECGTIKERGKPCPDCGS